MSIKTINETRTYHDQLQYQELDKSVAVKIDCDGSHQFFVDKNDWDKIKSKSISKVLNVKRKYTYLDQKWWNKYDQEGMNTNVLYSLDDSRINPFKAIELSDFDEDKLVWFYGDAHLFYKLGAKNPMSAPHFINYLDGMDNSLYDLDKAQAILETSPYTWNVKRASIPYYNADENRNITVEFMVRLPQTIHDQLCEHLRDKKKEEFWTVRLKECIVWKPWIENMLTGAPFNADLLGLKEAYIGSEYD